MPKKPKLTPEEKKELKAFKKAEKKRLAELKKKQLKHDFLAREVKYGKLTIERHEKEWKQLLLKITIPHMRDDLEFAWHNFERVIDAKDFKISLLMDEVRQAEEQYMMNIRSHSQHIDDLIVMFNDRLDEMKEDFDTELKNMHDAAEREVEKIRLSAQEEENYLKTMLYGLEMARKEVEKTVRAEYLSKLDEESTKYVDILQQLRAELEKNLGNLWKNTKSFLRDYGKETAEREKSYITLNQQDEAMQILLTEQLKKIAKSQSYIKKLKNQYADHVTNQQLKISDLLEEREYFADSFWTLKTRLEYDTKVDKGNFIKLTVKGNQIMEYLTKLCEKGEGLLSVASICRKYETQEEKVMPFPMLVIPYGTEESHLNLSDLMKDLDLHLEEVSTDLENFWQKVAQADAIRYSINEEREFLKREHNHLRKQIHEYCECLNCPTYPPIVNRRVGKINVIDGQQHVKNYKHPHYLEIFEPKPEVPKRWWQTD